MYIIRAMKGDGQEYSDIASFRSNKKAKEAIRKIFSELSQNLEDGWTLKGYMGIDQFTVNAPDQPPIIYYITTD